MNGCKAAHGMEEIPSLKSVEVSGYAHSWYFGMEIKRRKEGGKRTEEGERN